MPRKQLCFITATPEEVALLSKHGDTEALKILWEQSLPTIDRIAGHFHRRYPWIEQEDISQAVASCFPKIIRRFDPEKATSGVNRYLYFAFYYAAQDFLRHQDPLGVAIPYKKPYPHFVHFSSLTNEDWSPLVMEEIITKAADNMDRGYPPDLEWKRDEQCE